MSKELCPICLLAGGLGTRLGDLVADTPKPLLEVAGRPFIFHQLELLKREGANQIVLSVSYLGEKIEEAVCDGSKFGLQILYSYDGPEPIGTAAAVRKALPMLGPEFIVTYGDAYLQVDYRDIYRFFRGSGLPALMTVYKNDDRWDASNALLKDNCITKYDKRDITEGMEWIDYGVLFLKASVFDGDVSEDLAVLLSGLAANGMLAGYEGDTRFYEIGTPDSLEETAIFLKGVN